MNIVHLIERFEQFESQMSVLGFKVLNRNIPLFVLPDGWRESLFDKEFISTLDKTVFRGQDNTPLLPFDQFRLFFEDKKNGVPPSCAIVSKDYSTLHKKWGVSIAVRSPHGTHTVAFVSMEDGDNSSQQYAYSICSYIDGKWKDVTSEPGLITAPFLGALAVWYFTSRSMQRVEVSPNTQGKSVEWVKARSYYTVVHRRHAANNKRIPIGSIVANKTRQLTAHARKAHTRILRSAYYSKKQGQQIWVKSTWVGPKEWQDAESKQIYRIV